MDDVVDAFDDWAPGDVVVTNDPYSSGGMVTHTPDITILAPIFSNDRLIAFVWSFLHSSDVGGAVPGSLAASLTDVYQEGLRIPPAKLYEKGVLRQEMISQIKSGRYSEVCETLLSKFIGPNALVDGQVHSTVAGMLSATGPERFLRQLQIIMTRPDSRGGLAQIKVPVTVMVGREDVLIPVEAAEAIHESIAGSWLEIVEGSGHMLTLEAPERATAGVQRWLADP